MAFSYMESEQIINAVRNDLSKNMTIEMINWILGNNGIYDLVLIAVDEFINTYQLSIDDFLSDFTFEEWSDWVLSYNVAPIINTDTFLDAIHILENCEDIKCYIPINHIHFLNESCRVDDFFFYVQWKE